MPCWWCGLKKSDEVLLPPRQYKIVEVITSSKELNAHALAKILGRKVTDIMRDLEELKDKDLIAIDKYDITEVTISNEGVKYLKVQPERVILDLTKNYDISNLKELANKSQLSKKEFSAALGILRRLGVIKISKDGLHVINSNLSKLEDYVSNILKVLNIVKDKEVSLNELPTQLSNFIKECKRRGLIQFKQSKTIVIRPTNKLIQLWSEGKIRKAEVITVLTPEIIVSGKWREAVIKEFDLSIEPPAIKIVKKHPYIQFLNHVREIVLSMGFEEVKGPHVELELWNFDILFVPQYHPSRSTTDVYFVRNKNLRLSAPTDLLNKVREMHESKLKYRWDPLKALNLILRTHTTSVSMRTIYSKGRGEYRAFSLDRVFRPDTPDPTHLMEFHQLEGIIVGKKVTFKDLLGFFKEFARRLGLGEVKFKPAYFPFTEPSVEGYIKHPNLGWIEVFPGGMFRPEVLKPLGLEGYNVAAWGIGIDRIAMIILDIDDIRHLYTNDLSIISRMKVPEVIYR